jgi:hypothetical protein
MSENRVVRRIFGPNRDDVSGEWRNRTIRGFIICTDHPISRRVRRDGCITHMVEIRNSYKILVGNSKGKRPLVVPNCTWVDNFKMCLKKNKIRMYLVRNSVQFLAFVITVLNEVLKAVKAWLLVFWGVLQYVPPKRRYLRTVPHGITTRRPTSTVNEPSGFVKSG